MQSFNNWFSKRVKKKKPDDENRLRSASESTDFLTYTKSHKPPPAPKLRRAASTCPSPTATKAATTSTTTTASASTRMSFTDSLKQLLMPPEERKKRATKKHHPLESKQLVQKIVSSYGGSSQHPINLDAYIRKYNTKGELCSHRTSDLLLALVLSGVDPGNRGELWLSASGGKKRMLSATPGHFEKLCASDNKDDEATLAAIKQIDLDVGRTAGIAEEKNSNNNDGGDEADHAIDFTSISLASLRKVLIATSRELPHVGYCQSMNFLAAMLLEQLEEEEAFWVLVAIADDMLKGYYTLSLLGCRVDQHVFADLVRIGVSVSRVATLSVQLFGLSC
jgi:hypothetical protein